VRNLAARRRRAIGLARFDASGCGAALAAGSAAGRAGRRARSCSTPPGSARATSPPSSGGLSPGKLHAAELAADALHRALGAGRRAPARPSIPSHGARWWR
jgi:tRNA-specific 2-thiouridylase